MRVRRAAFCFCGGVFICLPLAYSAQAQRWLRADVQCAIGGGSSINAGIFNESDLSRGKRWAIDLGMQCSSNGYPYGYPNSAPGTVEAAYCLILDGAEDSRFLQNKNSRIPVEFYANTGNLPAGAPPIGNGSRGSVLHSWGNGSGNLPDRWGGRVRLPLVWGSRAPLDNLRSGMGIKVLPLPHGDYAWGQYQGNFTARWKQGTTAEAKSYPNIEGNPGVCSGYPGAWSTASFTVRLTIKPHCTVKTDKDISFKKQAFLDKPILADGRIIVNCSSGAHYGVGINNGNHSKGAGQRAMKWDKGEQFIAYNLYQNANKKPWTADWGSDTIYKGTGTADDRALTVYAEIPPNQGAKPPGFYRDTLVVEVKLLDPGAP